MIKLNTTTLNNLYKNGEYHIVYTKIGGSPKNKIVSDDDELLFFIENNIFNIDVLFINEVNIDVDQLKKNMRHEV